MSQAPIPDALADEKVILLSARGHSVGAESLAADNKDEPE
jgi:hypothetical protein